MQPVQTTPSRRGRIVRRPQPGRRAAARECSWPTATWPRPSSCFWCSPWGPSSTFSTPALSTRPAPRPALRGLDNYRYLFDPSPAFPRLWQPPGPSCSAWSRPGVALSLVCALLLREKVRGWAVFRLLFFLPFITPALSTSIIWLWIFNPAVWSAQCRCSSGPLAALGWIDDPLWAMPAVIIYSALAISPASTPSFFSPACTNIPRELRRPRGWMAQTERAVARLVTVPLLTPTIFFVLTVATIEALKVFTQIFALTGGGPGGATTTVGFFLYQNAFQFFHLDVASAVAVILFVIITLYRLQISPAAGCFMDEVERGQRYERARREHAAISPALPAARYAALIVLALLFAFPFYWMFVTSVEPPSRLSDIPPNMAPLWDWRNYADAWNAAPWGRYFLNTVFVSSAATAMALGTSLLAGFAFGTLRFPGKGLLFLLVLMVLIIPDEVILIPQYLILGDLELAEHLPGADRAVWRQRLRHLSAAPVLPEPATRPVGCRATRWLRRTGYLIILPRHWHGPCWPRPASTPSWACGINFSSPWWWPASTPMCNRCRWVWPPSWACITWNSPSLAAASVFTTLPLLVVFLFTQKHIIEGVAATGAGALKT